MIDIFLSSTYRDLESARKVLLNEIDSALHGIGMENKDVFIPDGITPHLAAIEALIKCDLVIFLITPYYGSYISRCQVENCPVTDCPMYKNENPQEQISFTHCEYKWTLKLNKPHLTYFIDAYYTDIVTIKDQLDHQIMSLEEIKSNIKIPGISDNERSHYLKVAISSVNFIENEVRKELNINFNSIITEADIKLILRNIADIIVDLYYNQLIYLKDFAGRNEEVKKIYDDISYGVQVFGVGGIGKTSLIQLVLLLRLLKGEKIVVLTTSQYYFSGTGYQLFYKKYQAIKNNIKPRIIIKHSISPEQITLNDLINVLDLSDSLSSSLNKEKIFIDLNETIDDQHIVLFIDNAHFADDELKQFILSRKNEGNIILATKYLNEDLTTRVLRLSQIPDIEIDSFIDLICFQKDIILNAYQRNIIKLIGEGHPITTKLLIMNANKPGFSRLEVNLSGEHFNISNQKDIEELMRRVVLEILDGRELYLLENLAVINTDLANNIDEESTFKTFNEYSEEFRQLVDKGMLETRKTGSNFYQFTFQHIKELFNQNNEEYQKNAVNYYHNKGVINQDDEVEILFHKIAIDINEVNIHKLLEIGRNLQPIGYGYKRIIEIENIILINIQDEHFLAIISGDVALRYYKLGFFKEALFYYNKALGIYKGLCSNSDIYKPYLAGIQNDLGLIYNDLRCAEKAKEAYLEAYKIRYELSNQNPNYSADLAATLNNLGIFLKDQGKFADAENAYIEAYKLREILYDNNPGFYFVDLAMTLNNLGHLYTIQNNIKAEDIYEKALKIYERFNKQKDDAHLQLFATIMNNIGMFYLKQDRIEKSEKVLQEALLLYRELLKKNSKIYKPLLANVLNNLGICFTKQGKLADAEHAFLEALEIRRKSAEVDPDIFLRSVSSTLQNMGELYIKLNRLEKTESVLLESYMINKELADKNSEAYMADLSLSINNLGTCYMHQNRLMEAEEKYEEAFEIYKKLAVENHDAFAPYLADILFNLGNLLIKKGQVDQAKESYRKALGIYKELGTKNPVRFNPTIRKTEYNLKSL